jgi:hypothetical protein
VIGVEWAQANHFFSLFIQIQVFRYDIDNVIGLLNPADYTVIPFTSQDISAGEAPS